MNVGLGLGDQSGHLHLAVAVDDLLLEEGRLQALGHLAMLIGVHVCLAQLLDLRLAEGLQQRIQLIVEGLLLQDLDHLLGALFVQRRLPELVLQALDDLHNNKINCQLIEMH